MSVEINWDRLTEDNGDQLSETIRQFLDQRFKEMILPSYLKSISVTSFDLGKVAPDIVIQRITDPFPEFYSEDDDSNIPPVPGTPSDTLSTISSPPAYENSNSNTNNNGGSNISNFNNTSNSNINNSNNNNSNINMNINNISSNNNTPDSPSLLDKKLEKQQPNIYPSSTLYSSSNLQYLSSNLQPNIIQGIRSPIYSPVNMQSIFSPSLSRANSPKTNNSDSSSNNSDFQPNKNDISSISTPYVTSGNSSINNNINNNSIDGGSNINVNNIHNDIGSRTNLNRSASAIDDTVVTGSENDIQLYLHIMYKGDIKVGIETTLLLNYPSPKFVSLPLKLMMSGLEINSIAALAYIDRRIHFSFICDADSNGDPVTLSGKDRVEIIKDIKIESEIGDREGNGPVLRNVGKIERFLLDRLRHIARDELAWPGWITVEI